MQQLPYRKKIRLPDYSYSTPGYYFITTCSNRRKLLFGRIGSGDPLAGPSVFLSPVGDVVNRNIQRISSAYPQVEIEKYVIMPNHVHLLVRIHDTPLHSDVTRDKMLIAKCMQLFKASVSRQVPQSLHPVWQSRFYDHIIRNEADYLRIWQYIDDNPAKWTDDCYYVTIDDVP